MTQELNLTWHPGQIDTTKKLELLGHNPSTIWLTGLSASGKSTLAFSLEHALITAGKACYVLDGDNIRHGLCKDLGFSEADRTENIRRISEVAKLMNDAGLVVICAFISPSKADRILARNVIGDIRFKDVYINTPIEICESRDPKGLYSKARMGLVKNFTGISAEYEAPDNPTLILNTANTSILDCVLQLTNLVTASN